jgi:hypothetical protein
MMETFGMQQGGSQYRRLIQAFQRVFGATIRKRERASSNGPIETARRSGCIPTLQCTAAGQLR